MRLSRGRRVGLKARRYYDAERRSGWIRTRQPEDARGTIKRRGAANPPGRVR